MVVVAMDQCHHNTEKIYGEHEVILPTMYEKGFDPPRITPWCLVTFKHSADMPLFQFITTSTFYPLKRAFEVLEFFPHEHDHELRSCNVRCKVCKVNMYDVHHLFFEVVREYPYVNQQGIGSTSMSVPVVKDMHFVKRGKVKEFCKDIVELHKKTCTPGNFAVVSKPS